MSCKTKAKHPGEGCHGPFQDMMRRPDRHRVAFTATTDKDISSLTLRFTPGGWGFTSARLSVDHLHGESISRFGTPVIATVVDCLKPKSRSRSSTL